MLYGDRKIVKKLPEKIVQVLNCVLWGEANSATSTFIYQPPIPEQLKRFKKTRK